MEILIRVTQRNDVFSAETTAGPRLSCHGKSKEEAIAQLSREVEAFYGARAFLVSEVSRPEVVPSSAQVPTSAPAGQALPAKAPAELTPILVEPEDYTPERQAEFILSSAVDAEDYRRAVEEVRAMGLDPDTVAHYKPAGV